MSHREERALFTAAVIAISTVVGSLAVGGVALATKSIVASEANRVMQTEANAREAENKRNIHNFMMVNNGTLEVAKQLDQHEYLSALGARSSNNYFNANELLNKISHLLNDSRAWELEDPDT